MSIWPMATEWGRGVMDMKNPPHPGDIFGSDLPDEAFADVFDQPRQRGLRQVDL